MGILLQFMVTYVIPIISIPSLIIIYFKVSILCWIDWSDALAIPFMF